jgi:hypothetical protein
MGGALPVSRRVVGPPVVADVQALADSAGRRFWTLIRSWIIKRIRAERGDVSDAETMLPGAHLRLAHLQRHLAHDAP